MTPIAIPPPTPKAAEEPAAAADEAGGVGGGNAANVGFSAEVKNTNATKQTVIFLNMSTPPRAQTITHKIADLVSNVVKPK